VRKIPVLPQPYLDASLQDVELPAKLDPAAMALQDEIRTIVRTDRELADKGAKAFVSSLQAYTKHEASFIFRVPDLDMASVGVAYGLLRLPAMPEIREWRKKRDRQKAVGDTDGDSEAQPEIEIEDRVDWEDADVDVRPVSLFSTSQFPL
jgi:ATP-dependent RNA helicase DDX55/SPB4